MAASGFTGRGATPHTVYVSDGEQEVECVALIDANCSKTDGVPMEIAGLLEPSDSKWRLIAASEHLVIQLRKDGEPYRMVLDAPTGRFVAREL